MKVIIDRARTVDLDSILSRPLMAHLSSSSPEGPRDTPVWFLWEAKAIWIIAELDGNTFHERLKEDPRCSVGVVDFDPATGRVQHVGIRGSAEVAPLDVERARRLLRKYLGDDEGRWSKRFARTLANPAGFALVKVTPGTVVARDVSYRV
jgi:hypothetical protein